MPDEPKKPDGAGRTWLINRLVRETGIKEAEASDLITMLGVDWSSLLREARIIKMKS
jgi:hypothetical protein